MVISADGEFAGFVSGGCVETDVVEAARKVLEDSRPRKLEYQKVDDSVFEIGLNCEGHIDVIVECLSDEVLRALQSAEPGCAATVWRARADDAVEVGHSFYSGSADAPEPLRPDVERAMETGRPATVDAEDGSVLLEPVGRHDVLLIVSVSSVAYPLCRIGIELGYQVVISDPRAAYLVPSSFPGADLINAWPRDLPKHLSFGSHVMVVSLNHEARFEDDLFRTLQSQPRVGYLGALGKSRRHQERLARSEESGVDYSLLPKIHTPIGLDLGGKSPEDVALSILSEIQAVRYGRGATALSIATV